MASTFRNAAAIAAVALTVLCAPWGPARAAHDGGANCYNCHALNANDVESGTASMAKAAMAEIKSHGWASGMRLGCTFCHRSANNAFMPDVLSSFSGDTPAGASRHPVSRNYVTQAIDNTPYLSTDNTSFAQHLDCRDCHDVTLTSYPDHDNNWLNNIGAAGRTKLTNPYGLRNVTDLKRYDNLCRTCHGSGVTTFPSGKAIGKSIGMLAHDNGVDNTANAIKDMDNTQLRTQTEWANNRQCSICHDAHESQNLHLFSDGTELSWTGLPETRIDERADCTTVCHFRGDAQGNFDLHGHGKPTNWSGTTLAFDCDQCHDVNQPHRPYDNNYFVKYRFSPFDSSWLAPSAYGKPIKSVCWKCHGGKPTHATARGEVGCIDCHDQHAKSSDNNVMMIRSTNRVANPWGILGGGAAGATVGSEAVLFAKSQKYPAGDNIFHYYTNVSYGTGDPANPGFCDQRACHGSRTASDNATRFTPLSGFLPSGFHSGGNITSPNGNCEACHTHTDSGGSFRASSVCTNCHGQPPPPQDNTAGDVYVYNEYLSPHRKHAGNSASLGYYSYGCRKCHVNYSDSITHNTTPKTFQSVFFDNSVKRGVAAYDNTGLFCTNIYCHSDGRGANPNVSPRWFDPANATVRQTLTCNGCHNTAMTTGKHAQHLAFSYRCSACHYSTVSDNNSVLNATSGQTYHVNGVRDVTINPLYDVDGNPANNWDNATLTCSGVTCHGGSPVVWTAATPTCDTCHSYAGGAPVTSNVYDYSFDNGLGTMSKVALGNFQSRGHGDNAVLPWTGGTNPGGLNCLSCHDSAFQHDNALNPFRFRATVNSWTVAPDNVNSLCTACHLDYLTRSEGHDNVVTGGGQLNWKHSQKCVDCHDVHGQTNIFMVYDNLAAVTDNAIYANSSAYGVPLSSALRTVVSFTAATSGLNFASTDNAAPYDGICEVCHRRTQQFQNSAANGKSGPGAHPTRACLECHAHGAGFAGIGGNNVEQFFDNAYRAASATDFNDRSGHPLTESTTVLTDPAQADCLVCHGASALPSTYKSNECLKCHFEKRSPVTSYHPNGQFEWAIPRTPSAQFGSAGPATDAFCLQCHGGSADNATLGGVVPINILPAGETSWTTGSSGHGSTTALSNDVTVGPPSYSCRDCHYSSVAMATSPNARDNRPPTFHASLNRKMVGNTDNTIHEYPHPSDNDVRYSTVDLRSGQMDWFCGQRCHGNAANANSRDDNVVSHAWNKLGGGAQVGSQTHPSNMAPTPSARFRVPDNLPLSENLTGAPPAGTGNEVCVTCHNPHGGGAVVGSSGLPLSGGNKQMMRRSWSDNASTVCKECHL